MSAKIQKRIEEVRAEREALVKSYDRTLKELEDLKRSFEIDEGRYMD